jgi:hypothetical protein
MFFPGNGKRYLWTVWLVFHDQKQFRRQSYYHEYSCRQVFLPAFFYLCFDFSRPKIAKPRQKHNRYGNANYVS